MVAPTQAFSFSVIHNGTPRVNWVTRLQQKAINFGLPSNYFLEGYKPQYLSSLSLTGILKLIRDKKKEMLSYYAWTPIWCVLDKIGNRTSREALYRQVMEICDAIGVYIPSRGYCDMIRREWSQANNLYADRRTYKGQPARNMILGRAVLVAA